MEVETQNQVSATNCLDCERYKQLGEVCVIEHGKKFLWEYCRDFQAEVKLPDYNDLMKTVRHDMALERKKIRAKKKKEILARRKEREQIRKEKQSLKRSKIAKRAWEKRRKMLALDGPKAVGNHRPSDGEKKLKTTTTAMKGKREGKKKPI